MLQQERSRPLSRVEVAYHDAGHYVVGATCGIEQAGLHLSGDGEIPNGLVTLPLPIQALDTEPPAGAMKTATVQLASWYLAGRMADLIRRGDGPPDAYDFDNTRDSRNACKVLEIIFDDHHEYWLPGQRMGFAILSARWSCVAKIAEALKEKGDLEGTELSRLYAAGLADPLRQAA